MGTSYSSDDSEEPVICRDIAIRSFVAVTQLIIIFLLLGSMFWNVESIVTVICVIYMLITFLGFIGLHRVIMTVHLCICLMGSVVPISYMIYTSYCNITTMFSDGNFQSSFALVSQMVLAMFFMIGYSCYTWMCGRLVQSVSDNTKSLIKFHNEFRFEVDSGDTRTRYVYPRL